ncbi:hypothetical protein Heshes_14650 [Alicyclobacillus hesperidum]|uniref:Uncharacterized protein n=1 Tax=Alicyclobacillus hesperidum TaxID=89784 RepID=A0AA37U2C3_9BACL|nr:hypothetical protein [Alicyclobacillus hesperidum]GLV13781.1 hypothetical protein Heshes_14650 [Alicyclobacillus hesperidum]
MNVWESLIATFVLACVLPLSAMAEKNILNAYAMAREMQGAEMVYSAIAELTLSGQAAPTSVEEGGMRYQVVQISYEAPSQAGCSTGYQVEIDAGNGPLVASQIPRCDTSLFSH